MARAIAYVLEILKEQVFLTTSDIDAINEILKYGDKDYSNEILNILQEKYLKYDCELALKKIKEMSKDGYLEATNLIHKLNK